MDLSSVIVGAVLTEKAERLKAERTHTLRVAPRATKVDVKNALQRFYDVEVASVRTMRTTTKSRTVGRGRRMVKRRPFKKVLVTLAPKSKSLDISSFRT